MKAIILAAGRGTRMGDYGKDKPKSLLELEGKSLLQRQVDTLRAAGIEDVVIVTGFRHELIALEGVRTFHNPLYATTNMVESLLCARTDLEGHVVVAYADILYSKALVKTLLADVRGDVEVAVDTDWRRYWTERYGTTETDLESLSVQDGMIQKLGRPVESSTGLDHRYVGLLKFNASAWPRVLDLYDRKRQEGASWLSSGKPFEQGYMTDLLNELIQEGGQVAACAVQGGWLEFDTATDYEMALSLMAKNTMEQYIPELK
jgi:L-glutamine-phosphate cytidylyltransferase